jgi:hypothetical protein
MTKLADAIRRSQRIEAAPMGFGAARPATKPTMVVGAIAKPGDSLQAYKDAGVDLVVIDARPGAMSEADARKLGDDAGSLTLGLLAGSIDASQVASLQGAGFDFLVFDADSTPAAALLNEDLGFVLSLPAQADELFLRSLESLSLDAVYLESLPSPLTVARQLELSRIGLFGRKSLICLTQAGVSAEDLRCLRAAGAAAVIASGAAAAKSLKEAVAALPPRKTRREERRVVSLPVGAAVGHDDEDDDDF